MDKTKRKIHKIDATDKSIGRLGTEIAVILRGKNHPEFDPAQDKGDIVEVYNIKLVKFTGKKLAQKKYFHYSGYPGGLKERKMNELYQVNPGKILKLAVKNMLPPVSFRTNMLKRLLIK